MRPFGLRPGLLANRAGAGAGAARAMVAARPDFAVRGDRPSFEGTPPLPPKFAGPTETDMDVVEFAAYHQPALESQLFVSAQFHAIGLFAGFVRKQQHALRVEHRDGIFGVLSIAVDEHRLRRRLRPIGGQPRAHGVEELAELGELIVSRQIHHDAKFAPAEPRNPAADYMNGSEQYLRQ